MADVTRDFPSVIGLGKNNEQTVTGYEKKLVQHQDTLAEPNRTGPERDSPVSGYSHLRGFPQRGRHTGAQLPQEILREAAARQVGLNLDERHRRTVGSATEAAGEVERWRGDTFRYSRLPAGVTSKYTCLGPDQSNLVHKKC